MPVITKEIELDDGTKVEVRQASGFEKLPFESMDEPNFQKCWALENLQPLEASENIRKGNKVYG